MLHMNKNRMYKDCYNMLKDIVDMQTERMIAFAHGQASGAVSYLPLDVEEWSNFCQLARKIANQKYKEIEDGIA